MEAKYSCFALASVRRVFLLLLIAFFLFSPNLKAQNVVPLKLDNIWVYDYTYNLIKTVVVDTNTVIDTLSYYKLESISNYGTIPSYGYARLREDEFYVIRLDTSYPAPNHELSYYKK